MNNNQENLHGMSRFGIFSHAVIEKCQQDYVNGNDLSQTMAGTEEKIIRQIISETYNADQLVKATDPDVLFSARISHMDDWSLAVLGEIMFQYNEQFQGDPSKAETAGFCDEQGWKAWEQILKSSYISPCISYDLVVMEIAGKLHFEQDKRAIEILKDGLAHAVMHDATMNVINLVRDLGNMYISFSEIEPGLKIFAELLLANPKDIWTYNVMAICLDTDATAGIGLQAARRGLELLKITDDEMGLTAQLQRMADELEKKAERQGTVLKDINPDILQKVETALTTNFDDEKDIDLSEFCRKLIPDLDSRSIKRYPDKIDLPSREQVRRNLADALSLPSEKEHSESAAQSQAVKTQQTSGKIGRNDPCPCGSGKKYKKCCLK